MTGLLNKLQAKPCPFCGGEAYKTESVNGSNMVYVGCSPCGIAFKAQKDCTNGILTKDIVAAWNQRKGTFSLRASGTAKLDEVIDRMFEDFRAGGCGKNPACGHPQTKTFGQWRWAIYDALAAAPTLSEGGASSKLNEDYCSTCNKLRLKPNVTYGINPDAVCNCWLCQWLVI